MEAVYFRVDGEPQGKGRPRFFRKGKGVGTYTPDKTVEYEERIKYQYMRASKGESFGDGPVGMVVIAVFGVPQSVSKKKRADMLDKRIRPCKKPDADNILKIVADSLNGLAYKDDTQIVSCSVKKVYGVEPHNSVFISGHADGLNKTMFEDLVD